MQETWVKPLGQKDDMEEEMATLSSTCLENPMDRGPWPTTVHRVTKGRTRLSTYTVKKKKKKHLRVFVS